MPELPDIMLAALPAFVVFILAELAYSMAGGAELYKGRDAWANVTLAFGSFVVATLTGAAVLAFMSWLYTFRLWTVPTTVWWAWALCFFAEDFSYYWFHRFSHEVRWFWASHSVHHSSEQYNFSVAVRQTWTGTITGSFLFWAWLPMIGFHPKMVLFMQSLSLIYQFWIHTRTIGRMPRWFEAIFNTPSHHRVHHGSDFDYLDANYAGTLVIWDRLFGSFVPETFAPRFGLTHNIESNNPLRIVFHEWINIARDLRKARGWRTMLGHLFQPPGWSADGSSLTTHQARAALRERQGDLAAEGAAQK